MVYLCHKVCFKDKLIRKKNCKNIGQNLCPKVDQLAPSSSVLVQERHKIKLCSDICYKQITFMTVSASLR